MNSAIVQEILDRIEQLSHEERVLLQKRLDEQAESEWQEEANSARAEARKRGIGQDQIDQVIEERRYRS